MASNYFNPINILNTSNATGLGTGGSLNVGGGISIGGDTYIGGKVSISGTTTSFADNILVLNENPTSSVDTGLLLQRFSQDISNGNNYSGIVYSETSDEFRFGYAQNDTKGSVTMNNFVPIRVGGITVTGGSLNTAFNSNTIGNIFTTGGNVGIGTTAPSIGYKLDVAGNLNVGVSGKLYQDISLATDGGGLNFFGGAKIYKQYGNGLYIVPHQDAYGTQFRNSSNNSTVMQVFGNGTVSCANINANYITTGSLRANGIHVGNQNGDLTVINVNTTNGNWLQMAAINAKGTWSQHSNIGDSVIRASQNLILQSGTSVSHVYLSSTGNVGISNSSPGYKLDVNGNLNFSGSLYQNGVLYSGSSQWTSGTGGNLFYTSGNVGIGTTQPVYKLELSTDSAAKPGTNTWTISSDARLKTNITMANLEICYNNIKNIPLKRYTWLDEVYTNEQVPDRSKLGWIAQDVETLLPKSVEQKEMFGYLDCRTLNSDQIIASLYGAVQKLIDKVEALEQQLSNL